MREKTKLLEIYGISHDQAMQRVEKMISGCVKFAAGKITLPNG